MTSRPCASVALVALLAAVVGAGVQAPPPWDPNRSDGTFANPIIHADYSDPDVVRVGPDYYLTASSFSAVPGLPILHSTDLVNWSLVNHALPRLVPEDVFRVPRHGAGVWAPAIRHHAGKYWIYYPDPDFGIYVITATDPRGDWSKPVLVKQGKGLIDPCPLWDDDGRVYLVHAFARSRAGFANVLHVNRMNDDATRVVDEGSVVVDGNQIPGYTTLEGPKFYKRKGWYYIFAPAGGVKQGWQSVFRARRVDGPYEHRIVLAQGATDINGPHQGALVDTLSGEWWFIHFQDAGAYGRIVHMQPVLWKDDWPVIGNDDDGDGRGEPRRSWPRPSLPRAPTAFPPSSDQFGGRIGLQWQWQANPSEHWANTPASGGLRLRATSQASNLWTAANLLLQKFPAPAFTADVALDTSDLRSGERAGLIVFGEDYAWAGIEQQGARRMLVVRSVARAQEGGPETVVFSDQHDQPRVTLRVTVTRGAQFRFAIVDRGTIREIGGGFQAKPGRWVGAKVGLFAAAPVDAADEGWASFARFTTTAVR
jgi:beta-xylosidase